MLERGTLLAYKGAEIMTASPEDIVVSLYDGAIIYLSRARESIKKGDIIGKHNNINLCRDIILELNDALNMEVGGELATRLRRLYLFMARYILQCSWQNNLEGLGHLQDMLMELRSAWATARDIVKGSKGYGDRNGENILKYQC